MGRNVLLTSAEEDSETILNDTATQKLSWVHAPLEVYTFPEDESIVQTVLSSLDEYETIVYGNKRNAFFFWKYLEKFEQVERAQKCLNLAGDEWAFSLLDEKGIPAVQSPYGDRAIDSVELLLRLQRFGKVLYPCGIHRSEDMPRLLEELDIPVTELVVFELEGPDKEELQGMRKEVQAAKPDTVIFHSRRAVTRTLAAFPDLDYQKMEVISADAGVSQKLEEKNIPVDAQAEGSWESIINSFEV